MEKELLDDYVQIIRADVEPIYYGSYDLNEVIFVVVKALQNVSKNKFYGEKMLADVLKGTVSEKVFERKLHTVAEFRKQRLR